MLSSEKKEFSVNISCCQKKNPSPLQQLPLEMLLNIISFWLGNVPIINEKNMDKELFEKLSLQLLEMLRKKDFKKSFPNLSNFIAFLNFTMINKFYYQLLTNCKLKEEENIIELIDEFQIYLINYINYFQKLIYWHRTEHIDTIKLGTGDIPYVEVLEYCKLQSVIQTIERAKLSNVENSTSDYYGYYETGDDEKGSGHEEEKEITNLFMQAETQKDLDLKLIKRLNKLNLTESDIYNLTQIERIGLIDVLKYQLSYFAFNFDLSGNNYFRNQSLFGDNLMNEINVDNEGKFISVPVKKKKQKRNLYCEKEEEKNRKFGLTIEKDLFWDKFKKENEGLLDGYCYLRLVDVGEIPQRTFHSVQFLTLEFVELKAERLQNFLKNVYFPNVLYLEIYLDPYLYGRFNQETEHLQKKILERVLNKKIFPKLLHLQLDGFNNNNILLKSDIYNQLLSITFLSKQFDIFSLLPSKNYEEDEDYIDVTNIEKKKPVKKKTKNQLPLLKYVVGEAVLYDGEIGAVDYNTLRRIYNGSSFVFSVAKSSINNFYAVSCE
ncbi:hypothetical protein ABK040_010697 [Willaertia magna]